MRREILILIVAICATSQVFAKSSKYSRKTAEPKVEQPGDKNPTGQPGPEGGTPAKQDDKSTAAAPEEKKVDLKDLEDRYWTAKDTEFKVVQNRLYTKEKRFSLTGTTGPLLSDTYTASFNFGLALNYYFSERYGVELQGWKITSSDSDVAAGFYQTYGLQVEHNVPKTYMGASFNWIPVYAKLSLLEKKILYFDFSVSPGLGITTMESVTFPPAGSTTAPARTTQNIPTLAIDFSQQVFLSEHWAIRLDARNHFLNEKVYNAGTGGERRTKFTYHGSAMVGITFFK